MLDGLVFEAVGFWTFVFSTSYFGRVCGCYCCPAACTEPPCAFFDASLKNFCRIFCISLELVAWSLLLASWLLLRLLWFALVKKLLCCLLWLPPITTCCYC